jgi:TonB family protein
MPFRRYVDTTLVYPHTATPGEKEVVVLKFTITPDGRPSDFRVIQSPDTSFTREAIRVIENGPDWNPATRNGIYVDEEVQLRIVFRPE